MQCHVHVDICFTINIVLYLYKYLYKGPDTIRYSVNVSVAKEAPRNEFDDYQLGRFLSSSESAWRILNYHITRATPSVIALGIHLPDWQLGQMWRTAQVSNAS